jgi:F0F1-type ATP synthase assembly protein I
MYAAITHYHQRGLVFYVIFAGITSLTFKVLAANPNGFLLLTVIGIILMAFGTFYTVTRSRMLEDKQKQDSESGSDSE